MKKTEDIYFKQAVKKAWWIMKKCLPLFILLIALGIFIGLREQGAPRIVGILFVVLLLYWGLKDKPRFKEPEPPKYLIEED